MPQALATDPAPKEQMVFADPLHEDLPGDEQVVTTRRALGRLALVASEVGSRFEREAIAIEPMAWMLAPRAALGGAAPIDACLTLDGCVSALVVHRLSLGMDPDREIVDMLRDDDDDDDDDDGGDEGVYVPMGARPRRVMDVRHHGGQRIRSPRLFTATVVWSDGTSVVHAFHASIATRAVEIAGRLAGRLGSSIGGCAQIREGFSRDAAFVEAMTSPAMRDMLALIADDPCSPLAAGLDLNVEQRFLD